MTTLGALEPGQAVNIEIDVLARYLQRMEHYRARPTSPLNSRACATASCPRPRRSSTRRKNGRMFILVDDEDRENEGDLVIPAQMATPGEDQLHGASTAAG